MSAKTFPVGMADEQRARFQKAADDAGVSLAAWIRDTCELRVSGKLAVTAEALGEMADAARPTRDDLGESSFKGPVPRPEKRRRE